jgi:CubicO group peptidase (beta-lactamase class C family)
MLDPMFHAVCEAAAVAWDVPSLAVATAVGDQVETLAIGCEPDARFRVASVTKTFTATVALGLLDTEDSTGVWPADVRIRHLLSHTSGYDSECGDLARFGDGDDALAALVAELPSVRRFLAVEQAWSYANSGYWLTGLLCADRAGSGYEDALTARILQPLGLEATSFGEPDLAGSGPGAVDDRPYPRARRPSGGLSSNVHDLIRFGQAHLTTPSSARLRIVHGKPPGGVYGLGLFGERVGGVEVWGHPGSYGGFESSLLVIPDRDAVFVGLTSSSRGDQALSEIEDAFFERVLGARRDVAETVDLPAEVLDGFAGTYANSVGWTEVTVANNGLVITFDDEEFVARAIGERTFEVIGGDEAGARFDFPVEGFGRFGHRLAERVS